MAMEDIVGIIFEDIEEVKPILSDSEGNDLEGNDLSEAILEYGISEGKYNAPHCQDSFLAFLS